jgi:hypothetical protein
MICLPWRSQFAQDSDDNGILLLLLFVGLPKMQKITLDKPDSASRPRAEGCSNADHWERSRPERRPLWPPTPPIVMTRLRGDQISTWDGGEGAPKRGTAHLFSRAGSCLGTDVPRYPIRLAIFVLVFHNNAGRQAEDSQDASPGRLALPEKSGVWRDADSPFRKGRIEVSWHRQNCT